MRGFVGGQDKDTPGVWFWVCLYVVFGLFGKNKDPGLSADFSSGIE